MAGRHTVQVSAGCLLGLMNLAVQSRDEVARVKFETTLLTRYVMVATNCVMQSFGRCCASATFFDTFYKHFLASSPSIRDRFINTDMAAQKHLLRAGVLNLVLYARGMRDTKLRALGESHSRMSLDIKPELYDLWIESFLQAVREHDHEAGDKELTAWREVLSKGINLIKSLY